MKDTYHDIARLIDISCVKSCHTQSDISRMISIALKYKFICAFALPCFTPCLIEQLKGSDTLVGGTIGFPSGCSTTASKVFETRELLNMGCDELDMVVNIGKLKSGDFAAVYHDVASVVYAAQGRPVKAILEVSLLTDAEIAAACAIAVKAGVTFVKTGTGWMENPTTISHIRLIKESVGNRARIKAAGGVRDLETLLKMKKAGCDRFGIGLQHAVSILREAGAPDCA